METTQIQVLTETFEGHAQQTETGIEYWLARDLQQLLGYTEWRNFNQTAVSKAKTACEVSGHVVSDHFVDVNKMIRLAKATIACELSDRVIENHLPDVRKMVKIGTGTGRQIEGIVLTCYPENEGFKTYEQQE